MDWSGCSSTRSSRGLKTGREIRIAPFHETRSCGRAGAAGGGSGPGRSRNRVPEGRRGFGTGFRDQAGWFWNLVAGFTTPCGKKSVSASPGRFCFEARRNRHAFGGLTNHVSTLNDEFERNGEACCTVMIIDHCPVAYSAVECKPSGAWRPKLVAFRGQLNVTALGWTALHRNGGHACDKHDLNHPRPHSRRPQEPGADTLG